MATATLPHHLIFDPAAPVPADLSKAARRRLAELRDAYRAAIAHAHREAPSLTNPEAAGDYLRPHLVGLAVEVLLVVPLDAQARPIGDPITITRGDVDGTDCGPRAVYRAALQAGAVTVIVGHNHPSGSTAASPADIAVTKRLVEAGRVVDVPLADHIIIAGATTTSIRREHPATWC